MSPFSIQNGAQQCTYFITKVVPQPTYSVWLCVSVCILTGQTYVAQQLYAFLSHDFLMRFGTNCCKHAVGPAHIVGHLQQLACLPIMSTTKSAQQLSEWELLHTADPESHPTTTIKSWTRLVLRCFGLRKLQRLWGYLGQHLQSFGWTKQWRQRLSRTLPLHQ